MSGDRFTLSASAAIVLTDLGLSLPNVLRRARLPERLLTGPAATLGVAQYYAFWQALDDEAADPDLPLRIGAALSVEAFDPPLFAAICSPARNLAAARIAQYKRLVGPLRLTVESSPKATTIATHWPAGTSPPKAMVLTELVFWVALTRIATRTAVQPLELRAPISPLSGSYADQLGARVEYDPVPSITFSADDAARPFLTANAQLWDYFEPGLRKRLAELHQESTTDLVRTALLRLLPAGTATMAGVARELVISSRTLQRRLQVESTTFQGVLQQTRETLARHYLSTPRLSTAEIAYLLGYDDTNSFYRAFRSWTGQTPERVREAAS